MDSPDKAPAGPLRIALYLGLFLTSYLAAIWLGLRFNFPPNNVSSFWPASGVYVAALLLTHYRYWPLIVFTSMLSVAVKLVIPEIDLGTAILYALANATEALLSAYLIRRLLAEPLDFSTARQVLVFFCAAIAGTGAASLGAAFGPDTNSYGYLVRVWWFANALGMVIVAPLIITWVRLSSFAPNTFSHRKALEALALGVGLVLTCQAVFAWNPADEPTAWHYTYMVLPFLIWAALRFDPRGVASAAFLIASSAIWYGAQGVGPFASLTGTPDLELHSLQAFVALIAFSSHLLSGVVTEREKGLSTLRESEDRFKQLAGGVGELFWLSSADRSEFLYVSPAFEAIWGRPCSELVNDPGMFMDTVLEEDREAVRAVRADPRPVEAQYRIVRPDGSVRWVHSKNFPILDEKGDTYRVAGIVEDVTERRAMATEMEQLKDQQDGLLLQAQTEEREMLARELHDGVGQMLVGLQLKLASRPNSTVEFADELDNLQQTIRAVSKISRLLYPPELEHTELVTAIAQNLTTRDASATPVIELESRGVEPPLTRPAKNHLYRITQEAITNVRKHAKASRVGIEVDWTGDTLAVRVSDDGTGIAKGTGYGIGRRSIQTRASAMGGRADWRRNASGGTTLEVSVPQGSITIPRGVTTEVTLPPESTWPTRIAGDG